MGNNERPWNACDNQWCDGIMQTISITCGADSGSKEMCNKCGRTVEHGWGPPRVRYPGRKRDEIDDILYQGD